MRSRRTALARFGFDRPLTRLACLNGRGEQVGHVQHDSVRDAVFVAFDREGLVFVSCFSPDRVLVLNPDGMVKLRFDGSLRSIGSNESGDGRLVKPAGLALHGESLFVADSGNSRICKFTKAGEFLGSLGSRGAGSGQFLRPWSLAISAAGELFCCDAALHRVQVRRVTQTWRSC